MGFLDRLRRKKRELRPQGEPPPELLEALASLPPQVAQRFMSLHSEQELMELLAEHPELMPFIEQVVRQVGRLAPYLSSPAQVRSGLQVELEVHSKSF